MSTSTWSAAPRRSASSASASVKGERTASRYSWPERLITPSRCPPASTTVWPRPGLPFGEVGGPHDPLLAVEEPVDLAVAVRMVAEGDGVGAHRQQLARRLLGDPHAARRVLPVHDHEVERVGLAQVGQQGGERAPAEAAHDVADEQELHDGDSAKPGAVETAALTLRDGLSRHPDAPAAQDAASCATWCARPSFARPHLVCPMFVQLGEDERTPVEAMPGVDRLSISHAVEEAGEAHALGVPAVLLFGLPAEKDLQGSGAYDDEGVVQLAVRALKDAHPELVVITDVCLCSYTSHGHCGVVPTTGVDNDVTLELLAKTAISHAAAGPTPWRPSDMMDGRVGALRRPARRRGLQGPADHRLLGEVRLRLLRPVPRGGRLRAGLRRQAQLPDGSGQRATRRCARRCSTWRRAPTW